LWPTQTLLTTYFYDANGNLVQASGWSYMWDYLNRMLASGFNNSTTTYAYDEFGSRVMQTSTTSSTYYPNKYYSFTSTKIGANTYATSTNYIWNRDTLLATIDQPLYNGSATGSPITRYTHPDHLGSSNAVTDQNGNPVQLMDYYPYGATRVATSTFPTNEKRQYIGQFSDTQTSLDYLNARYYNSTQGQFTSQDPSFLAIGDADQIRRLSNQLQQQFLMDPQQMNSYSYASDNPVVKKDPKGNNPVILAFAIGGAIVGVADQFEYDTESGQVSSVPQYTKAGLQGAGAGAVAGVALMNSAMSAAALNMYGRYETVKNVYDFTNQVLINPSNYSVPQQSEAASNLYRDLATRAVSIAIPKQYRIIYDALRSIYDSLEKINSQSGQNSGINISGGGSGGSRGSAGTVGNNGDGKTPISNPSGSGVHYCLGTCL
jgi:RHS repeat-associated protein